MSCTCSGLPTLVILHRPHLYRASHVGTVFPVAFVAINNLEPEVALELIQSFSTHLAQGAPQFSEFMSRKGLLNATLSQQGSPGDVLKDPRVQCWIENYRNLLDAWRFWHKRAEFDIHRGKLDPSSKPLAQVTGGDKPSVAEEGTLTFVYKSSVLI